MNLLKVKEVISSSGGIQAHVIYIQRPHSKLNALLSYLN